ncbi:MAG: addiction module protein, partial [Armatimonadetes bacterium]|nr:addiction module protein [Armatimonadota bacterium]
LEQMTIAEKLQVMEELWVDLIRTAETIPSPLWHREVLQARQQQVGAGTAGFTDWETAKDNIRASVK